VTKAANKLSSRGFGETKDIAEQLFAAMQKGNTGQLKEFGIQMEDVKDKTENVKNMFAELKEVAESPLGDDKISDGIENVATTIKNTVNNVQRMFGEMIENFILYLNENMANIRLFFSGIADELGIEDKAGKRREAAVRGKAAKRFLGLSSDKNIPIGVRQQADQLMAVTGGDEISDFHNIVMEYGSPELRKAYLEQLQRERSGKIEPKGTLFTGRVTGGGGDSSGGSGKKFSKKAAVETPEMSSDRIMDTGPGNNTDEEIARRNVDALRMQIEAQEEYSAAQERSRQEMALYRQELMQNIEAWTGFGSVFAEQTSAWIAGEKSMGAALKGIARGVMNNVAQQAQARAAIEAAEALASLAVLDFRGAAQHGAAAAAFVVASGLARRLAGSGGGPSQASAGSSASAPPPAYYGDSARGGTGGGTTTIIINVNGYVGDEKKLGQEMQKRIAAAKRAGRRASSGVINYV
jgi:hypothetical protein